MHERSPQFNCPNVAWEALVVARIWPQALRGGREWISSLPPEVEQQAVDELFDLLDQFLETKGSAITPGDLSREA